MGKRSSVTVITGEYLDLLIILQMSFDQLRNGGVQGRCEENVTCANCRDDESFDSFDPSLNA